MCCVNEQKVTGWYHKEVVEQINENSDNVILTVIDEKAFKLFSTLDITITHKLTEDGACCFFFVILIN